MFIYIYPHIGFVPYSFGLIIYLTQGISHLITACINPGIPSREYYLSNFINKRKTITTLKHLKDEGYKICKICNIIVHNYEAVIHCDDCCVCVKGKYIFYIK